MAVAAGLATDVTGTLFGFVLVFGWLLSFLTGVLQRIMPFLASMHSAAYSTVRPILPTALTDERSARLHLLGHVAGLALVAAGIVAGQPVVVRLGAVLGLAGAVALLWFALEVRRRFGKLVFKKEKA